MSSFEKYDPLVGIHFYDLRKKPLPSDWISPIYNLLDYYKDQFPNFGKIEDSLQALDGSFDGIQDIFHELVFVTRPNFEIQNPDFNNAKTIKSIISSIFINGTYWEDVSILVFGTKIHADACKKFWESYFPRIQHYEINPLVGPGAMLNYMNKLTEEKIEKSLSSGEISLTKQYESYNLARNELNARSYLVHLAAFFNRLEIIKIFEKHGADPNMLDDYKCNALSYAINQGYYQIILHFLSEKVEITLINFILKVFRMYDGDEDLLYLLLSYVNIDDFKKLFKSCDKKYKDIVNSVEDKLSLCKLYIKTLFETNYDENQLIQLIHNVIALAKGLNESDEITEEKLIEFHREIGKYLNFLNECKDRYGSNSNTDFQNMQNKIKSLQNFIENNDLSFVPKLTEDCDMNPITHSALSLVYQNKTEEALQLINECETQMDLRIIMSNPVEIMKKELINEENTNLMKNLFQKLSKFIIDEEKSRFDSCVDDFAESLCSYSHNTRQIEVYKDLLLLISTLSQKATQMRFRLPNIYMNDLNLGELFHICEEIRDTQQFINEIKEKRSMCHFCHKYTSSTACPDCGMPLTCLNCMRQVHECINCQRPLKVNDLVIVKKFKDCGDDYLDENGRRKEISI
ncbi:hypothetical protein TVAG_046870 [Trichomonas vaginalis G3]|uniref:Uncharacterized protein n=1 Tax=Trichomonas vaginalis (strain ATCC PRA-98 / G3) TaxID=412133 RepID=A2EAR2_TRIV3|nr:Ankyrin repeat family [Trichomonas vaginalis G3]EAY10265.1 hypothetical protein TVAG_046870 [Trichomonas vaginalis G3]KAI5487749.1 Ankyrin repeat family [Trichomonas vaginalis G3]|eukprot:XP_001322488.1 hypothetical protein [Trichomonas vaginalis G3]